VHSQKTKGVVLCLRKSCWYFFFSCGQISCCQRQFRSSIRTSSRAPLLLSFRRSDDLSNFYGARGNFNPAMCLSCPSHTITIFASINHQSISRVLSSMGLFSMMQSGIYNKSAHVRRVRANKRAGGDLSDCTRQPIRP
jgi:hypothetical protein